MADPTEITHRDLNEDSVRDAVRASFQGREPGVTDQEVDDAVNAVISTARANQSWRESRPVDEQLGMQHVPVVTHQPETVEEGAPGAPGQPPVEVPAEVPPPAPGTPNV